MFSNEVKQQQMADILALSPVLPVVVIHELSHAVPVARALVAGGITSIEVTLRTPVALEAIQAITAEVDNMVVGAGTVRDGDQLRAAHAAGARFAVSPGASPRLLGAASLGELPLLPGVATAGEVMHLYERGYRYMKLFPAVPLGGQKLLAAWASPLPQVQFCPTGGITPDNAVDFLALPNVKCVGGSWLIPKEKLYAGDWSGMEQLAREAAALRRAQEHHSLKVQGEGD